MHALTLFRIWHELVVLIVTLTNAVTVTVAVLIVVIVIIVVSSTVAREGAMFAVVTLVVHVVAVELVGEGIQASAADATHALYAAVTEAAVDFAVTRSAQLIIHVRIAQRAAVLEFVEAATSRVAGK